ncbi:MAG: CotH kinase family protein, partial [Pirellulaceae bacterium]|nr:CotH kinase family protein [Pirellulaceae bacterium]
MSILRCHWILLGALFATASLAAEPFRFSADSRLPIVIVDTAGAPIADEPKTDAVMSIIDRGNRPNRLTDPPTSTSRIRIEIRGASSQMFDKKSYGFESVNKSGKDRDVGLLGLPPESDWILYGPHSDKTLMRNYLAFRLSNQIGRYAPRARFAELFLRDSTTTPIENQYVGVYLLVEKLKRGDDRVDVPRLKKKGDSFSGGYIVKIDRVDGPGSYFTSDFGTVLGHVSPRGDRLGDKRRKWIQQDFSRFERSLAADNFLDPQKGYAKYCDADSFIDFFLLNELFKNVDAYFLSTYLHRGKDGRVSMGPIWDLNLSTGNASYGGVWHTEDWMLFSKEPRQALSLPFWWDRLFEDPRFRARLGE